MATLMVRIHLRQNSGEPLHSIDKPTKIISGGTRMKRDARKIILNRKKAQTIQPYLCCSPPTSTTSSKDKACAPVCGHRGLEFFSVAEGRDHATAHVFGGSPAQSMLAAQEKAAYFRWLSDFRQSLKCLAPNHLPNLDSRRCDKCVAAC
jgi:hypothetical protein